MTATKGKKNDPWDTFKADWLGLGQKKGSGKKKGGGSEVEQFFMLAVAFLVVAAAVTAAVQAATIWWAESFLPWFEAWRYWFTAGAAVAVGLAVLAVVLWVRAGWRRRIKRRAETRQPVARGGEKPSVKVETDTATRKATKAVVTLPDGVHTRPGDRMVGELADLHGRDLFGAVADSEVHINAKTGRTQVVLTPPEVAVDRTQVEQDLTAIAQEQLPHVQSVTVTARDKATGLPVRIEVHHEVTAKLLTSPAVAEAIERALAAQLGWDDPNSYRMHWDRERNVGVLEQCDDPLPRVVPFPFGKITDIVDRESRRLYYGVTAAGDLVYWDLDRAPHSLVAGKTGAGKTVSLTVFVVMALLMGWRVVLLDPKKLAFRDLDDLPNFERYGDAKGLDSAREMAAAIDTMHQLMEARYDLPRKELRAQQRILFVVDETYIGIEALNDLWAEEKEAGDRTTEHPSAGKLRRMSGLAREANMHMLMAIQRPDTTLMGKTGAGYMRSNLDNKIALGPMDSDGAPMMFGRGRWARLAQEIPAVKGRALTPLPEGVIGFQPAQVWWIDIDDDAVLARVVALVAEMHGRQPRLVDVAPAPDDVQEPGPVADDTKPAPVKKAAAKRAPTKKAATAARADGGPEVLGRDNILAGQLKRGDWTTIVNEDGTKRNVRIATDPKISDDDTVTISGFWGKRTIDATETVPRLHVDE